MNASVTNLQSKVSKLSVSNPAGPSLLVPLLQAMDLKGKLLSLFIILIIMVIGIVLFETFEDSMPDKLDIPIIGGLFKKDT